MSPSFDLKIDNLSVIYSNGVKALVNTNLYLKRGTICALVGANGSGKSTLFKSILGLIRPQTGVISIGGLDRSQAIKQHLISYVPQIEEIDWDFPISVYEVVMMGRYGRMGILRIPSKVDKEIVMESLKKVELDEYAHRQISELSGGQKKRVFLARSLAQESPLILLDEPFTGVDVNTEHKIIELLKDLRKDGHIILVSTHNLGSVPEFCDEVALMKQTVIKHGKTEEIYNESNLMSTFGDALRHFRFDESTVHKNDGRSITLLTDDERPLVLGKGGHLEYTDKAGKSHIAKDRDHGDEHD